MFHSFFEKLRSDVFREHPEEIQRRNLDGMGQYLVISMLVGCLMTFGSILFGRQTTIADVIALAVYFGLGFLFHELLRRNGGTHATPVLYAMTAVVLLTAIYLDTVQKSGEISWFFMIMLLVLPCYILDRPWRLLLYILAMSSIYVVCLYRFKDPSFINIEMRLLTQAVPASIGVCIFALGLRTRDLENELSLRMISEHDSLTGALNRGGGELRIREYLSQGVNGSFFLMDVDDFKKINDLYGHSKGDEVLECAAREIQSTFRTDDVVMRMGGDEFIVYAPSMLASDTVKYKISEIRDRISMVTIEGCPKAHITVSIGCIVNKTSSTTYDEIFRKADNLLYESKRNGKNGSSIKYLYGQFGSENKEF